MPSVQCAQKHLLGYEMSASASTKEKTVQGLERCGKDNVGKGRGVPFGCLRLLYPCDQSTLQEIYLPKDRQAPPTTPYLAAEVCPHFILNEGLLNLPQH